MMVEQIQKRSQRDSTSEDNGSVARILISSSKHQKQVSNQVNIEPIDFKKILRGRALVGCCLPARSC